MPSAHRREHSLEMQLPFLRRVHPELPIVPVLIGFQQRDTIEALADAIVRAFTGRRALLIASTDLSHYFDAEDRGRRSTGACSDHVAAFDADGLLDRFEQYPEHERGRYVACGGGAAIAVMKAARALGATDGRVLKYAHSGEVSATTTASSGIWPRRLECSPMLTESQKDALVALARRSVVDAVTGSRAPGRSTMALPDASASS